MTRVNFFLQILLNTSVLLHFARYNMCTLLDDGDTFPSLYSRLLQVCKPLWLRGRCLPRPVYYCSNCKFERGCAIRMHASDAQRVVVVERLRESLCDGRTRLTLIERSYKPEGEMENEYEMRLRKRFGAKKAPLLAPPCRQVSFIALEGKEAEPMIDVSQIHNLTFKT